MASPSELAAPELREFEPLAPHLTLGVGGPARYFTTVTDEDALRRALSWANTNSLPTLLLGGGSNLVCADAGYPGLVIELALRGIEHAEPEEPRGRPRDGARRNDAGPRPRVRIRAAAGEPWDEFVRSCTEANLAGLECLSGIPGRVGATPIQNVGAYGQEVADTITNVRCLDLRTSEVRTFAGSECAFGYRTSRFKTLDRDRYAVLSVEFELELGGMPSLRYPELTRRVTGAQPTLLEARRLVLALRAEKSMLLDPGDPNGRSCGSFFVNPVLTPERFATLERSCADLEVPRYPQDDGTLKVPAAWLIEQAGFHKGQRDSAVGLSTRHSLCVVAHEGATAQAVIAFARRIRDGVRERFSIELHPEPVLVGFDW